MLVANAEVTHLAKSESEVGMAPMSVANVSWLNSAWTELPDRMQTVLTLRELGRPHRWIASREGLSKSRIQQIEGKAVDRLIRRMHAEAPGASEQLSATVRDRLVIADIELQKILPTSEPVAKNAVLRRLGLKALVPSETGSSGWWTTDLTTLQDRLEGLLDYMPIPVGALNERSELIGLPAEFPIEAFLTDYPGIAGHPLGLIRTARAARDIAFLFMAAAGIAQTTATLARRTERTEHAIGEILRGDSAFIQLKPQATWLLASWPEATSPTFNRAFDVVLHVVEARGPINLPEVVSCVTELYPVSESRVRQCLRSELIGVTPDGKFDLVRRGATKVEDHEPICPPTMKVVGGSVEVDLLVDDDVLRGSSIKVGRWLTWYLRLRSPGNSQEFRMRSGAALRVTRSFTSSQISSVRQLALDLGVRPGCHLRVTFDPARSTASASHEGRHCPSESEDPATRQS